MDPLQQPVSEAPAVAEPEPEQPLAEPQAPEVVQSEPIAPEQPLEQEAPAPAQAPDQTPIPVSVNVEEPTPTMDSPAAPVEQAPRHVPVEHGYASDSKAHYYTREAEVHHSAPESTPQEADRASRLNSSPSLNQQPQLHTASRPDSGLSSGPERRGIPQPHPSEVAQREQAPQSAAARNSVVLKVGMIGDAQIGKTSLMVKYVENQWDEDYIQTLGKHTRDPPFYIHASILIQDSRCQLHGKDHLNSQY